MLLDVDGIRPSGAQAMMKNRSLTSRPSFLSGACSLLATSLTISDTDCDEARLLQLPIELLRLRERECDRRSDDSERRRSGMRLAAARFGRLRLGDSLGRSLAAVLELSPAENKNKRKLTKQIFYCQYLLVDSSGGRIVSSPSAAAIVVPFFASHSDWSGN